MFFVKGKRSGKGLSAAEALIDRLNKETAEVIRLQAALNQAVEDIRMLGARVSSSALCAPTSTTAKGQKVNASSA